MRVSNANQRSGPFSFPGCRRERGKPFQMAKTNHRDAPVERLLYSRVQTAHALGGISIATVQRMEARGLLDKVRLAGSPNGAVFHRAEQVRKLAEGDAATATRPFG